MTHDTIQLGLFLSSPYECSYLPNRQARSQVVVQSHWITTPIYSILIEDGFRRSGISVYRPRCSRCHMCISVRLIVPEFVPTRTQRRIFKKHAQTLTAELIQQPYFDQEHYALYERYQRLRHAEAAPETTPQVYEEFIVQSLINTQFVCFRDEQGVLRMVSVFDRVENGLSAVYTFYDPEYPGSLGTYAVMYLAKLCTQWNLPYLYLGYWVENSEKMHYKLKYHPLEYYQQGQWTKDKPTL
ncbi:arginyltransferase [Pelistega europaea]|uniref:Aspartate/glutamate leucyltransferase n=1 Tax=Pelistega europaea TaxID=106147 RepID=A0A7Y4LAY6_9BURK|nr:arginyltransferase [Pelistega europaea]NOL50177.1 arginyltransferase [Pelistega europaea]